MTYQTILYLIANAFRIYLTLYFFSLFYKERRVSLPFFFLYGTLFFAANSFLYLHFNIPLITIGSNVAFLYGTALLYKDSWQKYLYLPIANYAIGIFTECVIAFFPLISQENVTQPPIGITSILSDLAYLLVLTIIRRWKQHDVPLSWQHWFSLFLSPLLSVIIMVTLVVDYTISPLQLVIIFTAMTIFNIAGFWLYDQTAAFVLLQQELQVKKHQAEFYSHQLTQQKKSEESIRSMHHELIHHMTSIRFRLESNQQSEAIRYIDSIVLHTNEAIQDVVCANPTINGIINLKIQQAKEKGIRFDYQLQIPQECPISEPDLCVLLFNMLDNAIEAQEYVSKEREKYIFLHIYISNDAWIFRIENSCRDDLHFKDDEYPKSNKTGFPYHGYGIRNINHIANCYNGQHDCMVRKSVFYETVMLLDPILN